jgi:hypothetical protein
MLVLKSDHSVEITRTLERVPAACNIIDARLEDGRLCYDLDGNGAEMFWNDQAQEVRDGQRIFLDDDGNEYREGELEVIA